VQLRARNAAGSDARRAGVAMAEEEEEADAAADAEARSRPSLSYLVLSLSVAVAWGSALHAAPSLARNDHTSDMSDEWLHKLMLANENGRENTRSVRVLEWRARNRDSSRDSVTQAKIQLRMTEQSDVAALFR